MHIENQWLTAEIRETGAELASLCLKQDGTEYIWQADPEIWSLSSPLLFPIVGRLVDDQYRYGGHEYSLPKHGFARTKVFAAEKPAPDEAIFTLQADEQTLQGYPWHFILQVRYLLENHSLQVQYLVKNDDSTTMFFSIGGHPAFNCPLVAGEHLEDCVLEFGEEETVDRMFLVDGLIPSETEPFLQGGRTVQLTSHLFDRDAVVLEGIRSTAVTLKSKRSSKTATVEFPGFPFLGIWAKPGGVPYVCIEPWYGIDESVGAVGDIETKKGILSLTPGASFASEFTIRIT